MYTSTYGRHQYDKCDITRVICSSDGRSPVFQEKVELQQLNDRLSTYIDRIKNIRQPSLDPSNYQAAIKQLEDEISKIRHLYETELNRLRYSRNKS